MEGCYTSEVPQEALVASQTLPEPPESIILKVDLQRHARLRKIEEIADQAAHMLENTVSSSAPGLWLTGSESANRKEFDVLVEKSLIDRFSVVVIDTQLVERESSLQNCFIDVLNTVDVRSFEKLFYEWSHAGYRGIAFDVEKYTRGQIALAHRFELETMITGVRHTRHLENVTASGADHYVVEI